MRISEQAINQAKAFAKKLADLAVEDMSNENADDEIE
jgi:hypothetical protein